ncbi:MAG: hypothetical protein WKH64_08335 [Chloroflexia bacterium]
MRRRAVSKLWVLTTVLSVLLAACSSTSPQRAAPSTSVRAQAEPTAATPGAPPAPSAVFAPTPAARSARTSTVAPDEFGDLDAVGAGGSAHRGVTHVRNTDGSAVALHRPALERDAECRADCGYSDPRGFSSGGSERGGHGGD